MLVIAHRGFSGRYPENTALAFERAITSGAHLIETDLRLTRDGSVVCSHDPDLARMTGERKSIADATLAELKAAPLAQSQLLLTLGEVLAIARGKVRVMLDVKIDSDAMRAAILKTVRAAGMERDVVYGVRSVDHLRALRDLNGTLPVLAMPLRPELLSGFLGGDMHAARLWEDEVSPQAVECVRSSGLRLWVTAGRRPDGEAAGYITAGRLERLIALGAAAVLVNDVELAVRVTRARQCIT